MADPWLCIIGLGEDGLAGLPPASREALAGAEIVFGAPRHLALAGVGARGTPWPLPFDIAPLLARRGQRVAALVSGDPFWFGAGGTLAAALDPGEWRALPAPGVFSLAAARLGWRLEDTTCLGLHAAPLARLRPHLTRGCRVLATLRDGPAVGALAEWLATQGLGAMRLTVLERLGGPAERIRDFAARDGAPADIAAPVAVALNGDDLAPGAGLPRGFGLPDDTFRHDGQITRRAIRAVTLSALAPRAGEMLWDIGGGSGSVSVEWCLNGGRALCIEPRPDRLANIATNIAAFGLEGRMRAIPGRAPEALADLPAPDAVFVGGGADAGLIAALPAARLVVNAVTLETEALLAGLHAERGGSLIRLALEEAAPLGRMCGWTPARSVTQWSWP